MNTTKAQAATIQIGDRITSAFMHGAEGTVTHVSNGTTYVAIRTDNGAVLNLRATNLVTRIGG